MKQFAVLLMALLTYAPIFGQTTYTVSGTIVESTSKTPIEYATIILKEKVTDNYIAGTVTDVKGYFELQTNNSNSYVEVSFLGFESLIIDDIAWEQNNLDLGIISIGENQQQLEEVIVRGERSQTEFKLDKRVFNVGKDLSSTGASALEVLNNVPSVNVSIEGSISLRGSQGVQILINGKPSVLADQSGNALGSITADMIEKIEVITNPSAKYDAEGTAGILNIVLKKDEKKGLNGSVSLNTGIPNNHSLGLSINNRTEKFNLFSQFGIGHRTFPLRTKSENTDKLSNTSVKSEGDRDKSESFVNLILGTDYHINKFNVITLSGKFAVEKEKESGTLQFEELRNLSLEEKWSREEDTDAINPKYEYELQYKRDFKNHKEHDLLFSVLGSFFGKDQESDFIERSTEGVRSVQDQKTKTSFSEGQYTFQLDYTLPFYDGFLFETGTQYAINDVVNDYEVKTKNGDEYVVDPNFTNEFEFDQAVLGLYSTIAYENKNWGSKIGLRAENTELKTLLKNTNSSNDQNYTRLFPSAHISYNLSERISFQAGYSKRIFRPRLWDLNPFFNVRNQFSIYTGNPNLLPEYSDSYELTSLFKMDDITFNIGTYYRHTTDVVEDVVSFDDGVSIRMPINLGTNDILGLEANFKYHPVKWLTFMGDFNYSQFDRKGSFEMTSFDFAGDQWNSRLTSKLKLPSKIDVEISGNYRSSNKTAQGKQSDVFHVNLGVRKKVLKGKLVLNLSVRNLLDTRRRESITDQENYYVYNLRQSNRYITFGVSYGFGKGEAMQFSGRKHI